MHPASLRTVSSAALTAPRQWAGALRHGPRSTDGRRALTLVECKVSAAFVTSCGSDTTGEGPPTPRHRSDPRIVNVADEIANDFNLIGVSVHDFHASKLIFYQYQQFQTIKPVGPQIVTEVRLVRDTPDIDAEMRGNKRADLVDFDAFASGCSLSHAQASEGHDAPRFVERPHSIKQIRPTM